MQVKNNTYNSNTNFYAGLNPKIRSEINNVNIKVLEKDFLDLGIKCNFKNDKPVAGAMVTAINICQEAFKRFSLPFNYLPPSIEVYSKNELVNEEHNKYFGFCAWGNFPIIKDKELSDLGGIYINACPHNNDIAYYDKLAERDYEKGIISSNHFIGRFLHELFHNIHLNIIIDRFGANSCFDEKNGKVNEILEKNMSIQDRILSTLFVGKYSSKSYLELFSEMLTKMVTDSLDYHSLELTNNPMDNLKKFPKPLQKFIKKELE